MKFFFVGDKICKVYKYVEIYFGSERMRREKVEQYEIIKIITTILVVFGHVTRMYTPDGIVHPLNKSIVLDYITSFIYSFHMPLFVAVSGSIYYFVKMRLNKYSNNSQFIINKAQRLLIPYVVFGILYVAPIMILCNFTESSYLNYIIEGIILSLNPRHLWYIFMLFNVFMAFQFLNKYITKYPKLFMFIFILFNIASYKLPVYFQLNTTFRYLIYFYIGYLFEKNKNDFKLNPKKITITSFLFLLVANYLLKVSNGVIPYIILNMICAFLGIIFMYTSVQLLNIKFIMNLKLYKIIKENSFGIYLFHPMIIYVLFYWLGDKDINPFLLSFIIFVITMIISDSFTRIIRRLRLNVLIGEKNKLNLKKKSNLAFQ